MTAGQDVHRRFWLIVKRYIWTVQVGSSVGSDAYHLAPIDS
jgi:hypothetical protein